MKDSDSGTQKGLLRSRQSLEAIEAFLHEVKTFEIAAVKVAFDKARRHCATLRQDLFDADLALHLREKGPPAGPLFEPEAEERAAEDLAALEAQARGGEPTPDAPTPEPEKKRGRPRKEKPPERQVAAPDEPPAEQPAVVVYELRRDPNLGGATYSCRLVSRGGPPVLTGLSRPLEERELPAMTPENLPSLAYDETPEMLGWAAGQLKAVEP